jgi:hypothetical protein
LIGCFEATTKKKTSFVDAPDDDATIENGSYSMERLRIAKVK